MRRTPLLHFTIIGFMLAALLPAALARAGATATIDRDHLALDETLTLIITRDSSSFFSDPDLAPLAKDFKVMGNSHSSSTQIINGQMSASVEWRVALAPKRTGRLWIPPLNVGGDTTAPLSVTVSQEAPPKTRADNAPLFIETEVDRHQALVQEQILFTLRIYWAVQARIDEPDDPHLEDALLEKLDDNKFAKTVNGQTFQVFERRYAIFPQKSGILTIPQTVVRAVVMSTHDFGGFFDPFGRQGTEIKLRSREERITVAEKPAGGPAAPWLPSTGLTISRQWSQPPDQLRVGDSATLTITTTGEGLLAAQLPPITMAETDGVKLYQNKPELENRKSGTGITGIRRDSIALIPTRPGKVELPEIRIPWWNKDTGQMEAAVLPAQQLVIRAAAATASSPAVAPPPPPVGGMPDAVAPPPPAPPLPAPTRAKEIWWPVACALLATIWLATLLFWQRDRRRLRASAGNKPTGTKNAAADTPDEAAAYSALAAACRANDAVAARQALCRWGQSFWPGKNIRVAADLERHHPDPILRALLGEMDSFLYGRQQHSDQWNGMRLLAMIDQIRAGVKQKRGKNDGLPPLYKTGGSPT